MIQRHRVLNTLAYPVARAHVEGEKPSNSCICNIETQASSAECLHLLTLRHTIYPAARDIYGGTQLTRRHARRWKDIRHDQTVEWLAFWKDPINPKSYKYVFLGATSTFKTDSDTAKYEKARKLKDHIERIRADYQRLWSSKTLQERQMSTAIYFIDKLALRAGHEKDEDEADTVGCCTLKVCSCAANRAK